MAKLFRVAAVALGLLVLSTFGLVQQVTGLAADRTVTTRETITGLDAKAEVVRRMGLDPVFYRQYLRTAARFQSLGWQEVPEATVVVKIRSEVRPNLLARWLGAIAPALRAQSYSGSEGWASFNSWNDGDNTTWEGLVYGDTGNGVSGGVEVQYRTSNGTWEPVRLWDEPAGLNPDPDPLPSSWHGGACNGSNIAEHAMRHAMTQGSSYCAGAALGCAFMGPVSGDASLARVPGQFLRSSYKT